MNKFLAKLTTWAMDDDGATAIEYGLIAAGIAVVVFTLGDNLQNTFQGVSDTLANAG